jgi:ABC-type glycerol-3-phosphate transport system substrate-binding protein
VGGLQARADTVYKHKVAPDPATSTALSQMGSMLKTGAIAMDFTGGWAVWGELPAEFKFACAPNPLGGVNGSGTRVNNTWADPLQICSQTKNPDAAWTFVSFFVNDEDALASQLHWRTMIPARMDVLPKYLESMTPKMNGMSAEDVKTYYAGALKAAQTTVPCHILSGWAAGRDAMRASLDPVWLGEKQVAEVVDKMITDVNQKYDENIKALGLS